MADRASRRSARRVAALRSFVFTSLSALVCICAGLLVGFLVLLAINPSGAVHGILTILGSFMYFPKAETQVKYLGLTLAKTAPLVMCALSVIYANKVGLFNIGVAGQYVAGIAGSLALALVCNMPWPVCVLGGAACGALAGLVCGALKELRNVNEVISGILLNWIILYLTNMALTPVKTSSTPYTTSVITANPAAVLPTCGLDQVFGTPYAGLGIIIAIVAAIAIWARFKFTRFGFELKAVGKNKYAARSIGIREKKLTILAMAISGGLAGLGGTMLFLSGYEDWMCSTSSVPAMGFNGLAAGFLGGLNPAASLIASFFIQSITDGGTYLDTSMYSKEMSSFVAAVIIYLCGFMMMIRDWMLKRRERKHASSDVNALVVPGTVGVMAAGSTDSSNATATSTCADSAPLSSNGSDHALADTPPGNPSAAPSAPSSGNAHEKGGR